MSVTLSPYALIVPSEIADAAFDGLQSDPASFNASALAGLINSVTEEVERYVGRRLHIHADTIRPRSADWLASSHESYAFELWSPVWPLHEVTSADVTLALGTDYPGGQLLYSNTKYTEVAGFFGYARHDETLAGLQAIDSAALAALTALPETLPGMVRDVTLALCLHDLTERMAGRFSGARRMQQVGTNPVTIEAPDPLARDRILNRLHRFRRLGV